MHIDIKGDGEYTETIVDELNRVYIKLTPQFVSRITQIEGRLGNHYSTMVMEINPRIKTLENAVFAQVKVCSTLKAEVSENSKVIIDQGRILERLHEEVGFIRESSLSDALSSNGTNAKICNLQDGEKILFDEIACLKKRLDDQGELIDIIMKLHGDRLGNLENNNVPKGSVTLERRLETMNELAREVVNKLQNMNLI